jgi:type II secretory pathway pseudopilin PulG
MTGAAFHSKGITLLELLVAMTLMVVVAACLYTALYTGFRAHRSAQSAVNPTSQAMDAIELLKQDIYGVLPPTGVLAGAFVGTDQRGNQGVDADMLEFYTTQVYASSDEIVGGIGKIELALESDLDIGLDRDFNRNLLSSNRSNYKLVRKVTSNLLSPKAIDPDEQVLCRNVVSLNLRYFDGTRWVDEWDSIEDSNSLPRAVEIDIEVVDTTRSRYKSSTATATRTDDLPKRRLIQSFAIPCGLTAVTEEE